MIKVLVVDNEPGINRTLWETVTAIPSFEGHIAPDGTTARQMAKEHTFSVALIDLKLTETTERGPGKTIYDGIRVGEDIHKGSPETVIVMYSGDIEEHKEKHFDHYNDCVEAGADEVLARQSLMSMSAEKLGGIVLQWINRKQTDHSSARPLEFYEDWNTKAVTETVGKETLGQLIRQAIPTMAKDSVRALQPGYSGAFILFVKSFTRPPKREVETILKISQFAAPLRDELRRLPEMGSTLELHAETPKAPCVESQGWYAIAVRPVKSAMLLREFLMQSRVHREDEQIFSQMIDDLLIPNAKAAVPKFSKFSAPLLSFVSGSQMLDVLDQMVTWKSVLGALTVRQLQLVRKFIERSLNGHWTICGNYQVARLHGDFHCRNVFVSPNARAALIDFGRSDVYPRLLDFAALEADILLSVLDNKNGNDLMFSKAQEWYKVAYSGFPFKNTRKRASRAESRIFLLRSLLHEKMLRELDSVTAVEYSEALLFQFLRYLRFPTTTAPKKVLAVRLASSLIAQHRLNS